MGRYVISDHHFGHANIIEYCDRPFSSVGEMDSTLLDRHYETVDADDLLVHLGDVAMDMQDGRETVEYFQRLDGDLLVRGNHDVGLAPAEAPFPVLDPVSSNTATTASTARTDRKTCPSRGTGGCSTATTTTTTPRRTPSWRPTTDG